LSFGFISLFLLVEFERFLTKLRLKELGGVGKMLVQSLGHGGREGRCQEMLLTF